MENNESIAVAGEQRNVLAYRTDGTNHEIITTDEIAEGIVAAASLIGGFIVGFFLSSE